MGACVLKQDIACCGVGEEKLMYLPYCFVVSSCLNIVESGVGVDKGEADTRVGMLQWMKVVEGEGNLVG